MTMRPFTDARGGLNHLVDAQIGRAFPVVHKVYQHLDAIEYVAKVYEDGRARDIVLRTNHTKEWIEWQYKGEAKWTILFKFSDLLGADIADVTAMQAALAVALKELRQTLNNLQRDGTLWRWSTWTSAARFLFGPQGMIRASVKPWRAWFRPDFHPAQQESTLSQDWLHANAASYALVGQGR